MERSVFFSNVELQHLRSKLHQIFNLNRLKQLAYKACQQLLLRHACRIQWRVAGGISHAPVCRKLPARHTYPCKRGSPWKLYGTAKGCPSIRVAGRGEGRLKTSSRRRRRCRVEKRRGRKERSLWPGFDHLLRFRRRLPPSELKLKDGLRRGWSGPGARLFPGFRRPGKRKWNLKIIIIN